MILYVGDVEISSNKDSFNAPFYEEDYFYFCVADCLPLLDIGRCIELIYDLTGKFETKISVKTISVNKLLHTTKELIDALWEEIKEKL